MATYNPRPNTTDGHDRTMGQRLMSMVHAACTMRGCAPQMVLYLMSHTQSLPVCRCCRCGMHE